MACRNSSTLRGVFPQPRLPLTRDFIKENKQKLKASLSCVSEKRREAIENGEHCIRSIRAHVTPTCRHERVSSRASKKPHSETMGAKKLILSQKSLNCDKSVQTDDILDKEFLSAALKRCSLQNTQENPCESEYCVIDTEQNNFNRLNLSDDNSLITHFPHLNIILQDETQEPKLEKSVLKNDYQPMQIPSHCSEPRAQKDIISECLKRDRREKHIQKSREMANDPQHHYVLSEDDRKTAVAAAESKFRELVNELNRMPMSGETLRIKKRKMEIEKALIELENKIRNYSKPKVYVIADK